MKKQFYLAVALAFPGAALATEPYFELNLSASHDFRGGSELNESGTGREVPEFSLGSIDGRAAFTLDSGLLLQGGFELDHSFAETIVPGGDPSNDTYRQGNQLSVRLGQHLEDQYIGAYAIAGRVAFNPDDFDQDAGFYSLGMQAAWYREGWQVSGSIGYLNSWADDPETVDIALVLATSAAWDISDSTRLNGSLTFLDGEQDTDSCCAPDLVKVLKIGAEIEHTLQQTSYGSFAAYGGVSLINVWEENSFFSIDHVSDKIIRAGIRMRFGASSAGEADRRASPPLPEMLRLIGAVPAVD